VGVLSLAGRIVADIVRDAGIVREWALGMRCPLVYVSTSEIYGPQNGETPETADRIFLPGHSARMEYAVAKLAAETMLLNTPGLDVRIVRPFNVAGPRQKTDGGFVLPRFIEQVKAGIPLTVYQPGTQERAFTHVLDIVDGIVRVATQGKPGDIFNLGNPANRCSIRTLAEEVIAALHSTSSIEVIDPVTLWGPAFKEAPDKIPDITKARTELGWEPTRDRYTTIMDAA
jgi:UDP-glucose 4-epimerase